MIYVCVPVHNEASTVGLVLWKVRQGFTAFQREYQIIACDDASTDARAELLASLGAHARRMEVVPSAGRYDLKQRPSRSSPWQQLLGAWRSRGLISAARKGAATLLVVAMLTAAQALVAQDSICTGKIVSAHPAAAVPFPVGERLSFGARYGIFSVGSAAMEGMGIGTLGGPESGHIQFRIPGGALGDHLCQPI